MKRLLLGLGVGATAVVGVLRHGEYLNGGSPADAVGGGAVGLLAWAAAVAVVSFVATRD